MYKECGIHIIYEKKYIKYNIKYDIQGIKQIS